MRGRGGKGWGEEEEGRAPRPLGHCQDGRRGYRRDLSAFHLVKRFTQRKELPGMFTAFQSTLVNISKSLPPSLKDAFKRLRD